MDKRELPIQITVPKSEYIPYCDDLVRIVTIQFVIQFMMMLAGIQLRHFQLKVLYILAGVSMYWLILKKCLHSLLRPNVPKFLRR
jgi:hypothetical protein